MSTLRANVIDSAVSTEFKDTVTANGDKQWGDGIRLDPVDDVDFSARFSADSNGDLNILWERGTFPDVDIFYQNITSDGT